ncbi:hypothetical protein O6H91_04G126300 [Diphasiastrum complanatum]|uniref:Uncharacterized protein n=1 Tax=Diphasiastrum complanatum TaxID=34168 RepID=A0ACC2E252_DIPCM|nr:hypothetical protein O6H91_04G126300 [Diphasiastrum complanatum]
MFQAWQPLNSSRAAGTYPTLQTLMSQQKKLLHGDEGRALRYLPKVLVWIIRELVRRSNSQNNDREKILVAFMQTIEYDFRASTNPNRVSTMETVKQQRLNTGNWEGVELLDIRVLVQLLVDWLRYLQDPIIPNHILTKALSRGEIGAAIRELAASSKYGFSTIRILACWMLQIVPSEKHLRRRLYGGLAHVILKAPILSSTQEIGVLCGPLDEETPRKCRIRRENVGFKPNLLEAELALLLEAAAKYWSSRPPYHHHTLENEQEDNVHGSNSLCSSGRLDI